MVMRIGQVADSVGLPSQTIRFYERQGLLPPPRRGPNGYRDYDDSTVARLRFIRTAQTAGLTLGEIASIVDLRDDGEVPCSHVHTLLLNKLHDVRARQRELAGPEAELEHRIARSHKLDPADCTSTQICNILSARD